jgi:lipopolysaccharide transport system ATP-binding protein
MTSSTSIKQNSPSNDQDDEVLVRVEGISKKFCRDLKKSLWYGVKDVVSELNPFSNEAGPQKVEELRPGEFWANQGISFELKRGECLGLIGRNGAGKTTLLKMLNGLIKPDTGRIEIKGRIGALIALGAGFNPILTGRENIYVNGSILGLSREEIASKIDDIIDFAEIREFIDSPVQSYSSGMQVRLGFAVATALNPDVLILDEVLAVGDLAFSHKCYKRIGELKSKAALIFVSHNMQDVLQLCDRGVMLERGKVTASGSIADAISAYNSSNLKGESPMAAVFTREPLREVKMIYPKKIGYNEPFPLRVEIDSAEAKPNCGYNVFIHDAGCQPVFSIYAKEFGMQFDLLEGRSVIESEISHLPLTSGAYFVTVDLVDESGIHRMYTNYLCEKFEVEGPQFMNQVVTPQLKMSCRSISA